jgi:hypothetical protein
MMSSNGMSLAVASAAALETVQSSVLSNDRSSLLALPSQSAINSTVAGGALSMDATQSAMLSPTSNQAAIALSHQISIMAAVQSALTTPTSAIPFMAQAVRNHPLQPHPAFMNLTSMPNSPLDHYAAQQNVYSSPMLYEASTAASILAAAAATSNATNPTAGHPYLLSCPCTTSQQTQSCPLHHYSGNGNAPQAPTLLTPSMGSAAHQSIVPNPSSSSANSATLLPTIPNGSTISANATVSVQYRTPRIMKRPAGYSSGSSAGSMGQYNGSSTADDSASSSSRAPKLRRITSYEDAASAPLAEGQPTTIVHNTSARQIAELVAAVNEAAANAVSSLASTQQPQPPQALPQAAYMPPCPACVTCQPHLSTTTQHCVCHHHHHHCHHAVCALCSSSTPTQSTFVSNERQALSNVGTSLASLAHTAASSIPNATLLASIQQFQAANAAASRTDIQPVHSALLASRQAHQEQQQHATNLWYQQQQRNQSLQSSFMRIPPSQPVIMMPRNIQNIHHHNHHPMMELFVFHPNTESLVLNGAAHAAPGAVHPQHGTAEPQPVGASLDHIKKHSSIFSFTKDVSLPEQEKERCTVCLMDFETGDELRSLNCTHFFHVDCIDRWLVYNKKCPVCRVDMDKLSNTPLIMDATIAN